MSGPKILVDPAARKMSAPILGSSDKAWMWIGWFGFLIAVVGLTDLTLAFLPPNFGVAEWEFGTVASTVASLGGVTIGLAALLGSGLARGKRGLVLGVSTLLIVLAAFFALMLVIFALDIPVALAAVQGDIQLGIKKAIGKTMLLGAE